MNAATTSRILSEEEEAQASKFEAELEQVEARAVWLKKVIASYRGTPEIRWRKEIRYCILKYADGNPPSLATSNELADCVANVNGLDKADRNIKVKISTSLSLMFSNPKKREVGRITSNNGEDYLYGDLRFFEEDGETLKAEYQHMKKY
jgi:hypothetical protein